MNEGLPTILGKGMTLGTNQRMTHLNNNLLVAGAPGARKSRGVVEPNVMQANSSYIIIDPKGSLRSHLAPGLRELGYVVHSLDFANPELSDCSWNPFDRAKTSGEVQSISRDINTSDGDEIDVDPFWRQASTLLLSSLILATDELPQFSHDLRGVQQLMETSYMPGKHDRIGVRARSQLDEIMEGLAVSPDERERFNEKVERAQRELGKAKCRKSQAEFRVRSNAVAPTLTEGSNDREEYIELAKYLSMNDDESALDCIENPSLRHSVRGLSSVYRQIYEKSNAIKRLQDSGPARRDLEALNLYHRVRNSADRTWDSIRVSLSAVIDQWRDPDLLDMLSSGSGAIDLQSIGDQPTALFVVVSDTDRSLYPIVGVFVRQAVAALVQHADESAKERLDIPVRFILDDFATMCGGSWSEVDRWANATRSREIWWMPVVQSLAQLDDMMGASRARALISAFDAQVFVGSPNDEPTANYLASCFGSSTPSKQLHSGIANETVLLRGSYPQVVPIYDPEEHPNRKLFERA
jgi:type IV secretory pathway TraG/TraD family ATPase VirD4